MARCCVSRWVIVFRLVRTSLPRTPRTQSTCLGVCSQRPVRSRSTHATDELQEQRSIVPRVVGADSTGPLTFNHFKRVQGRRHWALGARRRPSLLSRNSATRLRNQHEKDVYSHVPIVRRGANRYTWDGKRVSAGNDSEQTPWRRPLKQYRHPALISHRNDPAGRYHKTVSAQNNIGPAQHAPSQGHGWWTNSNNQCDDCSASHDHGSQPPQPPRDRDFAAAPHAITES